MRSGVRVTLQFLALMAAGLLAAVVIALVLTGSDEPQTVGASQIAGRRSATGLDYGSFAVGMAFGIVLAWIGRVTRNFEIRQAIVWLVGNKKVLRRASYGAVFLCILFFY